MNFSRDSFTLNVGGVRYSFSQKVIKDFPLHRVSRLHGCSSEQDVLEVCDDYDQERNEYFFDRHSEAFGFILMYVKYGKLRFVPQMCELSFYNEMIYWGLERSQLEYCCQRRLDERMSDTYTYMSDESKPDESCNLNDEQQHQEPEEKKWLERMRMTFEEPTSSLAAQILAVVSIIFVIVSMVVLFASTLPDWKTAENHSVEEHRHKASLWEPSGYELSFYLCLSLSQIYCPLAFVAPHVAFEMLCPVPRLLIKGKVFFFIYGTNQNLLDMCITSRSVRESRSCREWKLKNTVLPNERKCDCRRFRPLAIVSTAGYDY
ncbi:hypothetical protein XELAEV_18028732mg [Xenopus laevis]|uniref:Potassium channel tetramerisation-type BTB domain-containing protein n=1 Tax=Xenopus laevis TaxID=8355 RepID=A0A974CS46_XENLA|nr:hypothetical protein XELAEV_18028732mg [Xenopus laevis]